MVVEVEEIRRSKWRSTRFRVCAHCARKWKPWCAASAPRPPIRETELQFSRRGCAAADRGEP